MTEGNVSNHEAAERAPEYTGARLAVNALVPSVGAAAATAAATGALLPSLAALAAGALIGYTISNQIPKTED